MAFKSSELSVRWSSLPSLNACGGKTYGCRQASRDRPHQGCSGQLRLLTMSMATLRLRPSGPRAALVLLLIAGLFPRQIEAGPQQFQLYSVSGENPQVGVGVVVGVCVHTATKNLTLGGWAQHTGGL